MEQERANELQRNIAGEALALLKQGCGEDRMVKFEQAIQLIGTAYSIPEDATNRLLGLIAQGKQNPMSIRSMEAAPDEVAKTQEYVMVNWSASDTFWVVMDLFQASTCMTTYEERVAMCGLAQELIQTQDFNIWLNRSGQAMRVGKIPA